MTVSLIYHEDFLQHRSEGHLFEAAARSPHPERPERLSAILQELDRTNPGRIRVVSDFPPAEEEAVLVIHSPEYLKNLQSFCKRGGGWLDSDTYLTWRSFQVAMRAAGAAVTGVDEIMKGAETPGGSRTAFALVRPPGHHAERAKAMGFCLLNNAAIAARYAQCRYGLKKILLLDWDTHHGNGTQHSFYHDPSILYFSIHQSPLYPGTGRADETGDGRGKGFTINVPLADGGGDAVAREIIETIFTPVATQYSPDLIIVSAGYDAHWADPLSGLRFTTSTYAFMARRVFTLAQSFCQGKILGVLEGGYHLKYLPMGVTATLRAWEGLEDHDAKSQISQILSGSEGSKISKILPKAGPPQAGPPQMGLPQAGFMDEGVVENPEVSLRRVEEARKIQQQFWSL